MYNREQIEEFIEEALWFFRFRPKSEIYLPPPPFLVKNIHGSVWFMNGSIDNEEITLRYPVPYYLEDKSRDIYKLENILEIGSTCKIILKTQKEPTILSGYTLYKNGFKEFKEYGNDLKVRFRQEK